MFIKKNCAFFLALLMAFSILSGVAESSNQVASGKDLAAQQTVGYENMFPIFAQDLKEGEYEIQVDSSSSMFKIVSCKLVVSEEKLTASMTMSGKGYLKLFAGTGEEAMAASENDFIPFTENENGEHVFTLDIEALDQEMDCAAFSARKEKWYERKLVFRADSLPYDAFIKDVFTTAEELKLADGEYTVEVNLEGGSGRASVQSPAALTVKDGKMKATLIWSSSHYDYMKVADEIYDPVTLEGGSTFIIPIPGCDWKIGIIADTTAMSTPHEIAYTLYFNSETIQPVQ